MSLFGRGNWSVFGVEPDPKAFQDSLNSGKIHNFLQSAVLPETEEPGNESVGINPFANPRLDEESKAPPVLDFSFGNGCYGFWAVYNGGKDVSDPASKKEAISYADMGVPFRFLKKKDKEMVEGKVGDSAIMVRRQVPVLVDFQHGRVYAETTGKDDILAIREILDSLGAKTFSLIWNFKNVDWTSRFLNGVNEATRFSSEMKSRADELSRIRPSELEKLADREMEKIVSAFFAFTPVDSGMVAALGCPSLVRIHPVSDPVGVTSPSVAFSLLNMTNDSEIAGASVMFLEPVTRRIKGGVEKVVNKPVFSLDINENVNCLDAGAALLRGLELPQFKRTIKTALKARGKLEIKDFWSLWLNGVHDAVLMLVDNVTDVLAVDKACGLVPYESETESTEVGIEEA